MAILPFDGSLNTFTRLMVDNICTSSLGTFQTTTPSGVITFNSVAAAAPTYTAQTYMIAQQVQALLDAFILSGNNFVDLSSEMPLQMFQGMGAFGTYKMTAGSPVYIYGTGFKPGTTGTLTNGAATVTLPVTLQYISPGLIALIAPDNTVPPYNTLDAANTNVLTFINGSTKFASSSATTTFLLGWT